MNKVHYKRQVDRDTACGRLGKSVSTALEWAFVTCKHCLTHKPITSEEEPSKLIKEGKMAPEVKHKYDDHNKPALCGATKIATNTLMENWADVTCEDCLTMKAGLERLDKFCDDVKAKRAGNAIIHMRTQSRWDRLAGCGSTGGQLTLCGKKANNPANDITDVLTRCTCMDCLKIYLSRQASAKSRDTDETDYLTLANMKAGSIGADFEKIMDANKQNRMVRLIINGLRVELRELRSYLQKYQEQLEEKDEKV